RARKRVVKRYTREKQRSLDWKIRGLVVVKPFFMCFDVRMQTVTCVFASCKPSRQCYFLLDLCGSQKKYLCKTDAEVKEAWAPRDLGYRTRVPGDMLIVTIVFCYSVIAPLIVPFGALYFGLRWLILRNQVLINATADRNCATLSQICITIFLFVAITFWYSSNGGEYGSWLHPKKVQEKFLQERIKIDEELLQEVVNMGFDRNQLVESLCNRIQNE
ncbi:hypothetical protein S83_070322, partial [Arachis hypogaea]